MRADVKSVVKKVVPFLETLLAIQSPVGFCDDAIDYVEAHIGKGVKLKRLKGGALLATVKGKKSGPTRALTAHVDTIGLCVKAIKGNGRLEVSPIGGVIPYTVEGEYCWVRTLAGKLHRGTVVPNKTSLHVHRNLGEFKHTIQNLEVRLDATVDGEKGVRKLGIDAGDLILLDTRTEVTKTGYIKSRYLDDKAGVAALAGLLWLLQKRKKRPARTTHFLFAVAEETGYGASTGLPADVDELIVVDMGAVGPGQHSKEEAVSICMKDGAGPYDFGTIEQLINICEKGKIPYKRDIYPYYGSDRQSFLAAGGDARVVLVGPGVDASHAYERTHRDALGATIELLAEYLTASP